MADLSDTLGAFSEVKLKGKMYKIGELTLGDWADFEARAKKHYRDTRNDKMNIAKELYGTGNIPADVFHEIVAPITKQQIEDESESIQGVAFLLHCAMVHGQVDITEQEVKSLIGLNDLPELLKLLGVVDDDESTKSKNVNKPASP